MIFQAGVTSKWTNDSQHFLLDHFDTINNSPSQIYHSALPLSPPSWLHQCYDAEFSPIVKVVKMLAEWGMCSRTTVLDSYTKALSYHHGSIAVGSRPGDIITIDTITGSQTAILLGHTEEVNCVQFTLDGASLVSGSDDKTVKLWDIQTGSVIKTFYGHTDWVLSVSISADCTTVASGSQDSTIRLWDIRIGKCYHKITQQDPVHHVSLSPKDSQYFISVSGGKVWQWDASGYQIEHSFDGKHISFSPDGAQFVSCYGGTITVHDSSSGVNIAEFQIATGTANLCSFSPDSRFIAVATKKTAYCWNIAGSKPQLVETFIGHTADITSLAFSSPTTLISASVDQSVKFWQIGAQSTGLAVIDPNPIPLPSAPIMSITLQAEDGIVITSDSDGMVKTWDILTGTNKETFQTPAKHYMRDVRLIEEGLVLIYHADKKIHAWDVRNGKLLWEVGEVCSHAEDLRISGDGSNFFYLYAPSIWAFSIQTREIVGIVNTRHSLGSGCLIVDGSKVWAYWPYLGYQGWDFSIPDSAPTELAGVQTFSNGRVHWDPSQGRITHVDGGVLFQLSGRFANPDVVQFDGSYLVAGYESREILILDVRDILA